MTYVDLSCITSIGAYAFNGCTSLTNINLSSTLTTIGVSAFNECTSLEIEDLALPNLEKIGT